MQNTVLGEKKTQRNYTVELPHTLYFNYFKAVGHYR